MATELGRLGVWAWLDAYTAPEAAAFAKRLEDWGYGALWIPGCSETDDPVVLQVASDLWIPNPDESSQC